MQIRMLNWEKELDSLKSTPCNTTRDTAGEAASVAGRVEQMFDQPELTSDVPPELPESTVFPVVLGCEVLYEMPHAWLVAAVLKRRLASGGLAIIVGAVRETQVRDRRRD